MNSFRDCGVWVWVWTRVWQENATVMKQQLGFCHVEILFSAGRNQFHTLNVLGPTSKKNTLYHKMGKLQAPSLSRDKINCAENDSQSSAACMVKFTSGNGKDNKK